MGCRNLRCLTRPSSKIAGLDEVIRAHDKTAHVEVMTGNLLIPQDCAAAVKDVDVVFHLAAGRGEKSFPDAFLNSVVTTRNLLDACVAQGNIRRFVNMSSFAVYQNKMCIRDRYDSVRKSGNCQEAVREPRPALA